MARKVGKKVPKAFEDEPTEDLTGKTLTGQSALRPLPHLSVGDKFHVNHQIMTVTNIKASDHAAQVQLEVKP